MTSRAMGNELDAMRLVFSDHLRGRANALSAEKPDSEQANKHVEAITALVSAWDAQGTAVDILVPLLSDARLDVRCEAARHLLFRGHEQQALPILESVTDNADATPATKFDARKALTLWRRKTGEGLE